MNWQGCNRFSARFTGSPRISYLKCILPDALFVNVVLDGRAVEMTPYEIKNIAESDYYEVRYEDYMCQPHKILSQLCDQTNIKNDVIIYDFVNCSVLLKNMNNKFQQDF